MAVMSDFQTDAIGSYEKDVLKQIMDAKPDLILLPGDYIQIADRDERAPVVKAFRDYLKEIEFKTWLERSKVGKFQTNVFDPYTF